MSVQLIKLATDDQKIVADITKRILTGESLEDIWVNKYKDKKKDIEVRNQYILNNNLGTGYILNEVR